jgi:hypothetical protein
MTYTSLAQGGDVQIDIDKVRIQSGGTTISIGERHKRGYYGDGKTWRDPASWEKPHGNGKGSGNPCPPGQAKKDNC